MRRWRAGGLLVRHFVWQRSVTDKCVTLVVKLPRTPLASFPLLCGGKDARGVRLFPRRHSWRIATTRVSILTLH